MTTDNRTNEPSEAQVEAARLAVHRVLASEWAVIATVLKMDQGQYDSLLSDLARAALTAAGVPPHITEPSLRVTDDHSGEVIVPLTVAGVTPQESATQPVEEERLGGTPLLNPEKVAEVLLQSEHAPMETHDPRDGSCLQCPWPLHMLSPDEIARALCEAHQEGRLTK